MFFFVIDCMLSIVEDFLQRFSQFLKLTKMQKNPMFFQLRGPPYSSWLISYGSEVPQNQMKKIFGWALRVFRTFFSLYVSSISNISTHFIFFLFTSHDQTVFDQLVSKIVLTRNQVKNLLPYFIQQGKANFFKKTDINNLQFTREFRYFLL